MRYLATALLGSFLVACGTSWQVAEDMPSDLEELVSETMQTVEEAMPAHITCLRDLTVSHSWEMDDRAEYRTASATVVLRVPATGQELSFSLAHEVAHHLEVTCDDQEQIRPAFLAAQGHPPDQAWFEGSSWESTPSEQFATAVATHVMGYPDPSRSVPLTEEAMDVVADWATG